MLPGVLRKMGEKTRSCQVKHSLLGLAECLILFQQTQAETGEDEADIQAAQVLGNQEDEGETIKVKHFIHKTYNCQTPQ